MKKRTLVVGCSYTKGYGLLNEHLNPDLWVNQLFSDSDIDNRSKTGANNQWIFLETLGALQKYHYDTVMVVWTCIPRYNFQVGLELYSVETRLNNSIDINLVNSTTFSANWLQKTGDRLRRTHNDHWDILNLVKYINALIEVQEVCRGGKIFFVNALCPWSNNYFEKTVAKFPSELDPYIQNMLQVSERDDEQIFQLYDMIHRHYSEYGGIQKEKWLNLYSSLDELKIDTISEDDRHPGLLSQRDFINYLRPILNNV